jgi:hypothetical protein
VRDSKVIFVEHMSQKFKLFAQTGSFQKKGCKLLNGSNGCFFPSNFKPRLYRRIPGLLLDCAMLMMI